MDTHDTCTLCTVYTDDKKLHYLSIFVLSEEDKKPFAYIVNSNICYHVTSTSTNTSFGVWSSEFPHTANFTLEVYSFLHTLREFYFKVFIHVFWNRERVREQKQQRDNINSIGQQFIQAVSFLFFLYKLSTYIRYI